MLMHELGGRKEEGVRARVRVYVRVCETLGQVRRRNASHLKFLRVA